MYSNTTVSHDKFCQSLTRQTLVRTFHSLSLTRSELLGFTRLLHAGLLSTVTRTPPIHRAVAPLHCHNSTCTCSPSSSPSLNTGAFKISTQCKSKFSRTFLQQPDSSRPSPLSRCTDHTTSLALNWCDLICWLLHTQRFPHAGLTQHNSSVLSTQFFMQACSQSSKSSLLFYVGRPLIDVAQPYLFDTHWCLLNAGEH